MRKIVNAIMLQDNVESITAKGIFNFTYYLNNCSFIMDTYIYVLSTRVTLSNELLEHIIGSSILLDVGISMY